MITLNYDCCHIFQCICNITIRVNGLLAGKAVRIPQTCSIYLSHLRVWLTRRHHQSRDISVFRVQLNLCGNSKVFALASIAHMPYSTCRGSWPLTQVFPQPLSFAWVGW